MPHENTALGLPRLTVALREHRADWAGHYASEVALLRKLIGDDLIAAAHVGSTAIPGIAAKPIIDIMVAVPTLDCAEQHRGVLAKVGY